MQKGGGEKKETKRKGGEKNTPQLNVNIYKSYNVIVFTRRIGITCTNLYIYIRPFD